MWWVPILTVRREQFFELFNIYKYIYTNSKKQLKAQRKANVYSKCGNLGALCSQLTDDVCWENLKQSFCQNINGCVCPVVTNRNSVLSTIKTLRKIDGLRSKSILKFALKYISAKFWSSSFRVSRKLFVLRSFWCVINNNLLIIHLDLCRIKLNYEFFELIFFTIRLKTKTDNLPT